LFSNKAGKFSQQDCQDKGAEPTLTLSVITSVTHFPGLLHKYYKHLFCLLIG